MKFVEVQKEINRLKKKEGKLISNIVLSQIEPEEEAEVLRDEKGIVIVVQEPNRKRAYYAVSDISVLVSLLQRVENGVILECLHREETANEMEKFFVKSGFAFYKKYVRITVCYHQNPYTIPEKGRRKIVQEMYDSSYGEYPVEEDAQELFQLTREVFDPLTDDVFTLERWKDIIQKKECILCREQGRIISYYVWQLEGKKLYSNITVNLGPANYSYNIERRVFEHMWNNGVRVYYAWFDMKNAKALNRFNQLNENAEQCIKSCSYMFNSIYIKE